MNMHAAVLDVDDLHQRLGTHKILNGVSFNLQRGELLGLIGANGSGKSTLVRCIAGLIAPEAGHIAIAGHAIGADPVRARGQLGFAVDPSALPATLTGWQCLELFAGTRGLDAIPGATLAFAEALYLVPMLHAQVARYSLGMRQKLSLCLALLGEPALLLLDESLNGLDPLSVYEAKQWIAGLVRREQCAVLLATHMLDTTQDCITRVALLHEGAFLRTWNTDDLHALRNDRTRTLELSMIESLRAAGQPGM